MDIKELLDLYFENKHTVNGFSKVLAQCEGIDITDEEAIKNKERQLRRWKSGKCNPHISNIQCLIVTFNTLDEPQYARMAKDILDKKIEIKKQIKKSCNRRAKGRDRYAWDIRQSDKDSSEAQYKYNHISRPPFLTDEEFEELDSLYPSRDVYEEILSSEDYSRYSEHTKNYIAKMNRYLLSASMPDKDAIEYWRSRYIYYSYWKSGRLYGTNILGAPREIFIELLNIWIGYYRGGDIGSYYIDYFEQLGQSLALLAQEGDFDAYTQTNKLAIGEFDKYEAEYINRQLYTVCPYSTGATPIVYSIAGLASGKLEDILKDCYEANLDLMETEYKQTGIFKRKLKPTKRRYKVYVSPNYKARKYYNWYLNFDSSYNKLYKEEKEVIVC